MRSALTRIAAIITDLKLFTPTNLEEEKARFFNEPAYNPQFTYPATDFPLSAFRKDLERYLLQPQDDDERLSLLVQGRVRELLLWLELHEKKGTIAFTDVSLRLYGRPSARMTTLAKATIANTPKQPLPERKITATQAMPLLEAALRAEGLDWPVVITDGLINRVHVVKGKELRLNKNATFSAQDIQKLIVHEVKTHAKRYRLGSEQDNPLFETGTARFLETEEGLATYNEEQAGFLTDRVKRNLAARVIAVNKALTGSFRDVYDLLRPILGRTKAFEISVNVKRGLADTSKPGGFTKAHVYYVGWQKIHSLPTEDLPYLYVGKVSYEQLPIIKALVQEGKVRLP